MYRKGVWFASALMVLSGCNHMPAQDNPNEPTLKKLKLAMLQNIHDMDEDMAITDLIGLSGQANQQRFEKLIRDRQCGYKNLNPPIVFISDVTLGVTGKWTSTGQASVGTSSGVLFSIASGDEQTITLPLQIMSLSALPDYYLDKKVKQLKDVRDLGDIPQKEFQKELRAITANYSCLKDTVATLQNKTLDTCP